MILISALATDYDYVRVEDLEWEFNGGDLEPLSSIWKPIVAFDTSVVSCADSVSDLYDGDESEKILTVYLYDKAEIWRNYFDIKITCPASITTLSMSQDATPLSFVEF